MSRLLSFLRSSRSSHLVRDFLVDFIRQLLRARHILASHGTLISDFKNNGYKQQWTLELQKVYERSC